MRKKWMIIVAPAAAILLASCGSSETTPTGPSTSNTAPPSGAASTVTAKLLKFEPEKITVKAGTPVTWKVSDGIAHTVTTGTFTADANGLRSAEQPDGKLDMPLTKDKEVSFTFDQPGTYTYYCSIHKGMNGEAEVTP